MALMLSDLYTALLDAGASDDTARKAAEEGAQYENRLTRIETQLESLSHRMNILLTGMVLVLGGVLSTLWVLARH
jgi:hypothetical protein